MLCDNLLWPCPRWTLLAPRKPIGQCQRKVPYPTCWVACASLTIAHGSSPGKPVDQSCAIHPKQSDSEQTTHVSMFPWPWTSPPLMNVVRITLTLDILEGCPRRPALMTIQPKVHPPIRQIVQTFSH